MPEAGTPLLRTISKDGRIEQFLTDNEARNGEGVVVHQDNGHPTEDAERHPCVFVDQLLIRETHPEPTGDMSQKACERDVGGQLHRRFVDEVGPSLPTLVSTVIECSLRRPGCVLMGQTAKSAAFAVIGSPAVATRVPSISQRRSKGGTVALPPPPLLSTPIRPEFSPSSDDNFLTQLSLHALDDEVNCFRGRHVAGLHGLHPLEPGAVVNTPVGVVGYEGGELQHVEDLGK